MISFWVTQDHSLPIRNYCQNRGRTIAGRFQMHLYDEIKQVVRFPGGAQIFSAIDQLTNSQREVAATIWDAHARAAPGAPRLNNPRDVLLRFQLLTKLYEQGINTFRVFRATDVKAVDRFPVFVREINSHNGPLTELLNSRPDVVRSLRGLRLKGYRLRDLMIEEFCDTSIADGLFRKYSAFKVGDSIIPCHLFVSHRWRIKSAENEPTEATIREENEYLDDNPHEDWLRRVFAIGRANYGRVDYGALNGVPQVWEINLNPSLGRGTAGHRHTSLDPRLIKLREPRREVFHNRLRAAFVALDNGTSDSQVTAVIERALLDRLRGETAKVKRRQRVLNWLHWLYHRPLLGLPLRSVYTKLFPLR